MIPMAISDPSSAKSKASVMRAEILGTKRLSSLASKRKALEGVFELIQSDSLSYASDYDFLCLWNCLVA